MTTKCNQRRQHADPLANIDDWVEQHEYAKLYGKFSSPAAIRRDITNRKFNGLERADAIRKVGRRFLIHRHRYTAFRLGELL